MPLASLPLTAFHFVRHGETDWNRTGRMQGWRDIPLNATGEGQARALRAAMSGYRFGSIAASPLSRARRTAEILNARLGLDMHFIEDLREFDVGPYEGSEARGWFADWRAGATRDGVESFADFTRRIHRGMTTALALPGPILVVAHGGVVWALEHLLALPVGMDIANTTLVHFRPEGDHWQLDIVADGLESEA
ncbi:histidine phosphatase family protein [Dongia sp.]|uniref:histidine phosphatase family protein n=1 Tax=Dongia sp. TaxID=1977262 RepID=UPI0035B436E0